MLKGTSKNQRNSITNTLINLKDPRVTAFFSDTLNHPGYK